MYKEGKNIKKIVLIILISISWQLHCEEIDIFNDYQIKKLNLNNFDAAEVLVQEAKELYLKKKFNEAIDQYIIALNQATNPTWYYELGDIYYDNENFENSRKAYETAGDLDYIRKDLAYYNAACCSSLLKNEYNTLHNLQLAFDNGYDFWNHMDTDKDLDFIKDTDRYIDLVSKYKIPEILNNPEEDFPDEIFYSTVLYEFDLNNDNSNELIIFCSIDGINDPLGTYYFALYQDAGNYWSLINKTIPFHRSIPSEGQYFNTVIKNLRLTENIKPFIAVNIDNDQDKEILIPSTGLTYRAVKILDMQNNKLKEIGEIEGFERIVIIDGMKILVGHQVTDFAINDGTSEQYSSYQVMNGKIETLEMIPQIISIIREHKYSKFENEKSIANLSSLFWFLYNHDKSELSLEWTEKYIKQLNDQKYAISFMEVMRENIE